MPVERSVHAAEKAIDERLPELAREVIQRHLDPQTQDTLDFLARPDGREQHQQMWHQWGIITHTRIFLRYFEQEIPALLRKWGLWEPVDRVLTGHIDGASRWELLRISILLHDIGKFGARTRGRQRFHFTHHEHLSGEIIRNELSLLDYGLTPAQVEYIATTAEDHFVLGLLRKRARELGHYDEQFVFSDDFERLVESIKIEHPADFVEIGVLFLGDSLAKVDPATGPEQAVNQYQTNITVAHYYLTRVLS